MTLWHPIATYNNSLTWSIVQLAAGCLQLLPHIEIKRIFRCYEVKIEESEKAGSRQGLVVVWLS